MDKTKHPDWLLVLTYCALSFCWAGKNMLAVSDMLICALSGLVRGAVTVCLRKIKIHDIICRGVGTFFAALATIEIVLFTGWAASDSMTIIGSMIPSLAAGSMLIEGMCTAKHLEGKQKIRNAILISITLAVGVFLAVAVTKSRGLTV